MSQRFGSSGKSKRLAVVIAGLLILSVVGVALAAAVAVDTFNVNPQTLAVTSGTPLASSVIASAAAVGGERDILLEYVSVTGASVYVDAIATDSNRLDFNQDSSSTSIATITWDGVDPSGTELQKAQTNAFLLGSVDLLSSGPANDADRKSVV